RARMRAGIGYVPQDRQRDGLVLPFTLTENMMLREAGGPFSRYGWLTKRSAKARTQALLDAFDVRPPRPDAQAGSLSGGNQQKVILAREVARRPKLLIAVQPTRGLDVGAIEGIHRELLKLRDEGSAVLLVSLELEEIMALADRIIVMHAGQVMLEVPRDEAIIEEIGLAMTGERFTHTEVMT
ncbi:MAG: ATP-binding cassette domain-containing protein, partial [Firmicutes bacterium]|nr:ATP-binding cassette domain-containing protein [Bacillota bacterium]